MVLTAAPPTTEAALVVSVVSDRYVRAGTTVVDAPFDSVSGIEGLPGHAVVAADIGVVECVLDDGDAATIAAGVSRLAADGWAVTILVPSARLGEAHAALRRRPARLQPWWLDADGEVCFGGWEVP